MPELRLQSDMLNNMSLAQQRAMMQRGAILRNQRDWLDYVQARDGGAFQGGYYSDVVPRGGTNPYQKYYAAMQAKQIAFQRQRFLNAQRFQNDYMLQQQKFMLGQAAEEQKVERTRKERERKLAVLNKEIDAIKNNSELDQNSFEVRNMIKQLQAGVLEIETELEINPVDIQKIQSDYLDKDGKPIETQVYYQPDGKAVIFQNAKEIAAQQLEKDKFEQAKIDAARKANHDEAVLEETRFNNRTARLKERNTQDANERKASGADVDPIAAAKKAHGTAAFKSLLDERKIEIASDLERDLGDKFTKASLTQQRNMVNQELKKRDEIGTPAYKVSDRSPIHSSFRGTPTKGEVEEEAMKRYDRTQPTPDDELNDQAMYESPMDSGMEPEFSDEQFAGTEPAGLYDPTGQPLPMDGGMYNGLA